MCVWACELQRVKVLSNLSSPYSNGCWPKVRGQCSQPSVTINDSRRTNNLVLKSQFPLHDLEHRFAYKYAVLCSCECLNKPPNTTASGPYHPSIQKLSWCFWTIKKTPKKTLKTSAEVRNRYRPGLKTNLAVLPSNAHSKASWSCTRDAGGICCGQVINLDSRKTLREVTGEHRGQNGVEEARSCSPGLFPRGLFSRQRRNQITRQSFGMTQSHQLLK